MDEARMALGDIVSVSWHARLTSAARWLTSHGVVADDQRWAATSHGAPERPPGVFVPQIMAAYQIGRIDCSMLSEADLVMRRRSLDECCHVVSPYISSGVPVRRHYALAARAIGVARAVRQDHVWSRRPQLPGQPGHDPVRSGYRPGNTPEHVDIPRNRPGEARVKAALLGAAVADVRREPGSAAGS